VFVAIRLIITEPTQYEFIVVNDQTDF